MMLPPFRIRDLYGQARHGVVHISLPQYDDTLKSHPDAALRYLDEDDGETITVGSGFELSQRLEDPVPQHKAVTVDDDQIRDCFIPQDLHTFDIERTSNSIATWIDHEAYSSKSLRSLSRSSTNSSIDARETHNLSPMSIVQDLQPTETTPTTSKPVVACNELEQRTELDMYEEMFDKEVQSSPPTLNDAVASTQVDGSDLTDSVEKIVSDAVQGIVSNLDSHIDTLADFLQNTSKALRIVAEKTRESDTSAVEGILSGFNAIFGEVGKLAKAVLDTAEMASAVSPVELDLQQIHETSCDKGKAKEEVSTKFSDNELSASVEVIPEIVSLPSPVLPSKPRPIGRLEILPGSQSRLSSRLTELTARMPLSQLDKIYHIPSKSFIEGQPQEVPADKDQMYATLERGGFNPDSDRTWKYMPLPNDDQVTKAKKRVDFALPNGTVRPRETAKSSAETFPRSILDLEASDPDFSARFPPLISVRCSKTMDSLRQRSQSPENRTRSRQDALKRFPSLGQLERRKMLDDHIRDIKEDKTQKTTKPDEQPVSHMHRTWFDTVEALPVEATVKDSFMHQSDEVEQVIAAVGRDITEASNEVRRLPGAWPEAQVDSKTSLPTMKESSGAFFNRMTSQAATSDKGQRTAVEDTHTTQSSSSDYQDDRARQKMKQLGRAKSVTSLNPLATLTTPFDPLVSSTMVEPVGPRGVDGLRTFHQSREAEDYAEFNPFFNPGNFSDNDTQAYPITVKANRDQSSLKQDVVHHSATEKMPHRRPYSHRYSGAGRLPWESFEDRSFDLRTGSFVQRQERARRAADRPVPQQLATFDAASRQWTMPESSTERVSNTATARQNPAYPIHKQVDDFRQRLRHHASMPSVGISRQSKINECVQQLKGMGFGSVDANEASRLPVYAAATSGQIFEAVEMIEEDRKAGASLNGLKHSTGPENGPGGWL